MRTTLYTFAVGAIIFLGWAAGNAAANPSRGGPPPMPANQIVGTWEYTVQLGPCNGPLNPPFRAIGAFHLGGTLSESNATPLTGVPSPWGPSVRGPGYGAWRYDPTTGRYHAHMRFYWFVNGVLHGHQQIDRELTMVSDTLMTGTITAERHFVDGTPPVPICGIEEGARWP
jgi:hypothetical protein